MPLLSSWALDSASRRYVIPPFALGLLAADVRSRDCHPEAVGQYVQAIGHAMQRSRAEHEDHLLMHCVQGRGWLEVDGQRQPIGPGDAVLLPAGVAHAYAADVGQPWTLYWAHFGGDAVQAWLAPLLAGQAWRRLHPGLSPLLLAEWRALLESRAGGYEPDALQVMTARLRLLLGLLAQAGQGALRSSGRLDVAAVQAWMQAHLDQPITLAELAAVAGMEKFHFARRFRSATGQAPVQHFLHRRMARACEWLDAGEDGIGEIANRLGYADAHYFSRQFRQIIGMAPSAYRALKRG
ncbi:MAG: AraC family transcriptional regulator [Moraxellaceae bacterium]|nr:AraC family transcriptional regulator [Moraxellaceae bacterium]